MLLTKECDYGIRIIRALACGMKKNVEAICQAEQIPVQYSYKILNKLEKAGFLQSLRGRAGGYRLIKSIHDFTLYDVIVAVDSNLFLTECLRIDKNCPRNTDESPCAVHQEYTSIQEVLIKSLRRKSVHDVMHSIDNANGDDYANYV